LEDLLLLSVVVEPSECTTVFSDVVEVLPFGEVVVSDFSLDARSQPITPNDVSEVRIIAVTRYFRMVDLLCY
jgi:hypothetical protein